MKLRKKGRLRRLNEIVVFVYVGLAAARGVRAGTAEYPPPGAQRGAAAANPATRPVGTIKTITGKTIVLTTDAGAEVTIQVQDDARLVRIEPGEKDLKNAAPLQLADLQAGDRILVRGKMADDGKTVVAASVIAMKSADIAAKQTHEREEWQKHGVGGLVTAIDAAGGTIKISTNGQGAAKEVIVLVSKQTTLRRYAPNSVKFDDAKPAGVDQIKVGDQLRARGTRNADGTELTADEVVSGTFRNIAGTINAIDASARTITVMDLVAKKPTIVKIAPESQLRKLPAQMAQVMAMRLKGTPANGAGGGNAAGSAPAKPAETAPGRTGGGGDLQQALSRMPATTLAELQKGDAVMIVATEGAQDDVLMAITLLAGVEPLLQASPAGGGSGVPTLWNIGGPPAGDTVP